MLQHYGMSKATLPEERPRTLDLSQTLAQLRTMDVSTSGILSGHGMMECFCPKGFHFHTGRCRRVLGWEGLHLQNIWYGSEEERLASMSDSLLSDLAGNAFNVNCCAAAFVTALVAVSFVAHAPEASGLPTQSCGRKARSTARKEAGPLLAWLWDSESDQDDA